MLANGIRDDLDRDDAVAVCEFLVETKRAIPPQKWIDSFLDRAETQSFDGLF